MLTPVEILLLAIICVGLAFVFILSWRSHPREIFSPQCMFSLLILYYVVIGPLSFFVQDRTVFLGVDLRPVFWKGWLASAVAYSSFLMGYLVVKRRGDVVQRQTDGQWVLAGGCILFGLAAYGMLYWILKFGGGISFLSVSFSEKSAALAELGNSSVLAVYLSQLVNLSFGAACLLWLYVLDGKSKAALFLLIVVCTISVLFFVKTGFRYRLAWLLVGLAGSYYLWTKKRPSLLFWIPSSLLFIFLMGLIGMTRTYFAGLSLERTKDVEASRIMLEGFGEAGIFFSVCQVVDTIPHRVPHTYFDPIWVAITYPIPRSWWDDKPTSATLATLADTFGGTEAAAAGIAIPFYGEWFIAFGWFGLIGSSFVFGVLCKKMWNWYVQRSRDKLATVIYAVSLGFIYVAFSRGMLAQAILNFGFALLPMFIVYTLLPKVTSIVQEWGSMPFPGERGRPPPSTGGIRPSAPRRRW